MFKNLKINTKLITIFMIVGLVPLGTIALIAVNSGQGALEGKAFDQLISLRDVKKGQIEGYFFERLGDVNVLSTNPEVVRALEVFDAAYQASGVNSAEYNETDETYGPWLTHYMEE